MEQSEQGPSPEEQRELRLRIGRQARELVAAAVRRDALGVITLSDEILRESYAGMEVSPEAERVPGPSYLQALLAYVVRVASAAVREALDGDDEQVEDLLNRVMVALEIGDTSI
jgi:hypothetical protein